MASSANAPSQIISLPKGGGAQSGLGEKFSPDLHTGTGNFTVPIALPPGRNGFQPQLNLVYSTGNGNGLLGLGWGLSIPGVTRLTSKGNPRHRDYDKELKERDTFILSGAEDLVPVEDVDSHTARYRPRTEGLFAKIIHHHNAQVKKNYWEACSKDGLISYYGTNPDDSPAYPTAFQINDDPAVVAKPKANPNDAPQVFAWKLTLTKDPFDNRIEYLYDERDQSPRNGRDGHMWDQPLLKRIRYVDYKEGKITKFLVTVTFDYEEGRDDPFSGYRAGFEIRTTKRCKSILIETHADKDYKVRRYEFTYTNDTLNKVSLLRAINVVGFDDDGIEARELPPLEFSYSDFNPKDQKRRDFYPIQGPDLPATSLANSSVELVDLFGNGLPDVLEMNGTVRYWRNRGTGQFDLPRPMKEAPAGLMLTSVGVQMIDANGDGRTDLLVTQGEFSGYYPLQFGGHWDRRSFQKYTYAPSFDLKDPEVRFIDLTGDGISDALRSSTRLECFFNDQHEGWNARNTRWVERKALKDFPNVNFSDPRVRFADMTGDGMQDIVMVYDGNCEYWPNQGYGNWGKRLHMENSPRFPYGYDPKRILLGDVDGDGLADLIYVDDRKVTLWINQNGNAWSDPIEIQGTPPVSNMDGTRLVDMLGSGIAGVLWTKDATSSRQDHYLFLDLTGGTKPYMLWEMDNNMGAVTKVKYESSTKFYLEDEKKLFTHWRTPLPFPVQVVSRVEVIDGLSQGKLTTEYRYHHGYWDGDEREFRGFGLVEQLDTETFEIYNQPGLHGGDTDFARVSDPEQFSGPTLTKTWFHQGPVGEELAGWDELDLSDEYWPGDPQLLEHTDQVETFLKAIDSTYPTLSTRERRAIKRDALRALRGSILRTELYALDGSSLKDQPYTVTEQAYGLKEIEPPGVTERDRLHIFFPHSRAQRTTQWERGDDPMTRFSFSGEYDDFGQPLSQTAIAMPRRTRKRLRLNATEVADETRALATHSRTAYATPASGIYIHDRVAYATSMELRNPSRVTESDPNDVKVVLRDQKEAARQIHSQFENDLDLAPGRRAWQPEDALPTRYRVFGHTANHYDGNFYAGLAIGKVGTRGALTLSEVVIFTNDILTNAYKRTPLINVAGQLVLPPGAPNGFGTDLGYRSVANEQGYIGGFYVKARQTKYDFHDPAVPTSAGLTIAQRDPLGHETKIRYDLYGILPEKVIDPVNLQTQATYNYRVMQPEAVTDPNDNVTEFKFSQTGLLTEIWIRGKANRTEGDRSHASTQLMYDFLAYRNGVAIDPNNPRPISVRTLRYLRHDTDPSDAGESIETREYSDGFGRLLQTRTQGEEVRFGDPTFGGGEEVLPSNQSDGRGNRLIGRQNTSLIRPNVTVSGWQRYDNKGRVVEKHEPFFDIGWDFNLPVDKQLGEKATMFYDPRGQVIRTVSPDGSEQRVIYGVPASLTDPPLGPSDAGKFSPTPWEAYTYDANDLAAVSYAPKPSVPGAPQSLISRAPRHHHFTPFSIVIDCMGRTVMAVQRNRDAPGSAMAPLPPIEELRTRSTYDIQGNLLAIMDPLDREALVHAYDLSKRVMRIESIDAGTRRLALDAGANEVQRRDSKGSITLSVYDSLNRSLALWARDRAGQTITMRERMEYGDGSDQNQSPQKRTAERNKNRLGKLAQNYDEAGRVKVALYDFKGNLVDKSREVISDNALAAGWIANWSAANSDNDLDGAIYQTTMQYDALNRSVEIQHPVDMNGQRARLVPTYNRAGLLEQITLDGNIYVERIAYNAKGQRLFIAYGNSVFTRYAYDKQTFNLKRLRTEHFIRSGDNYQPNGVLLQDFAYDYDLIGNILAIHDRVSDCGVPNDPNKLDRTFGYDAIYRLTSATGRECNATPPDPYWLDLPHCQDFTRTRPYAQKYTHDPAGNLTVLKHVAPNNGNFTRTFTLVTGNNQLDKVTVGTTQHQYAFDDNGNLKGEAFSRVFKWDHRDRLSEFQETGGAKPSKLARYLYDTAGVRIKHWVRRNSSAANDESTVYVDSAFESHQWKVLGQTRSNNRLHVMDRRNRIALVRVGDVDDQKPDIQYQLGDHIGSSNVVIGGPSTADNGLINREEFFPYGQTSFGSFEKKRYGFTGALRDEESGLHYHGRRYCAPWLMRWLSCDPIRESNLNLYHYCSANPLKYIDADGKADGAAVLLDSGGAAAARATGSALSRAAASWGTATIIEGGAGETAGMAIGIGEAGAFVGLAIIVNAAAAVQLNQWRARSTIEEKLRVEGIRLNDPVQMKATLDLELEGNLISKNEHLIQTIKLIAQEQKKVNVSRSIEVAVHDPSGSLRKTFMSEALKTILSGCEGAPHPLEFLVDPIKQDWKSRTHLSTDPTVQAGHDVSGFSKLPFDLSVEDSFFNQLTNWTGETAKRDVFLKPSVDVCGVRVELKSLQTWAKNPDNVRLRQYMEKMGIPLSGPLPPQAEKGK